MAYSRWYYKKMVFVYNYNALLSGIILTAIFIIMADAQDLGRDPDDPRGDVYGSDRTWHLRRRFRLHTRYNHPTHMILAPKILRPGTVYKCVVSILYLDHPVEVRAAIQKDGVELTSSKKDIIKGSPETLLLQLYVEGNIPGSIGGTVFANETRLQFSYRFLTVLFQMNRPVYTGDQTVRFRIVLLNTELKPYDDPVDVFVLDPDGYVMRRWPSRPTNVGVISMAFRLPFLPKIGWWKLRVLVNGQSEEKMFKVEKWYTPRFETKVHMQRYFLETDYNITGWIQGEFQNDKGVYGNATVRLYGRDKRSPIWTYLERELIHPFYWNNTFNFSMQEVSRRFPKLDETEIRVEVDLYEAFMHMNHTGFSHAKIINSSVNCRFIGSPPFVFKPGMPFDAALAVSYHDLEPLPISKLLNSRLDVKVEAVLDTGVRSTVFEVTIPQVNIEHFELEQLAEVYREHKKISEYKAYSDAGYAGYDYNWTLSYQDELPLSNYITKGDLIKRKIKLFLLRRDFEEYRSKGIYRFRANVPKETVQLVLSASYQDDEGSSAGAQVNAVGYYSFHVISKELLLYAGIEDVRSSSSGSVKTMSIPVSSEMAPSFRFFVYHMTTENEIISDSVVMPVDGISRHKVKLIINKDKDHTLREVEMGTYSTAGAFFGISGNRYFTYAMQGGNELTYSSVLKSLHGFAEDKRSIHKMSWRYRHGYLPEVSEYFMAGNYGPDSNRTIEYSGLIIFTDAYVGVIPNYARHRCNESEGLTPCQNGDCIQLYQKCNGYTECADGSDEAGCYDPLQDTDFEFRVHQFERFVDFYDLKGDWLWFDINIGYRGFEQTMLKLPNVDDRYIVNGFSISQELGFGLIPHPQEFLSMPPVYITVEMPKSCRRGEQVSMRVMLFNKINIEMMVMLTLYGTDKHRVVLVEDNGEVDFYKPRTAGGDFQHLVSINPESSLEVVIPVVATIDYGDVNLTISALSQVGSDEEVVTLTVEPEGATIDRHTSFVLDLKNRAVVYEYMDIIIDETFEIPLQIRRRFVAGSPRGHISICGDVVGPSFPNNRPVDSIQMLRRPLRGTEASAFNFGANLWTLHYLRLTNQLDYYKVRDVFDQLNVELAAMIYRFDRNGAFHMWDTSEPSVWLTAWVVRLLQQAQFQDWENLLYIEPQIISRAISWLVKWQAPSGAFMETPAYQEIALDQKMNSYTFGHAWRGARNISLTAHCLIAIEQTMNSLQGNVRSLANNARIRALRYLEYEVNSLSDPYELAITAYALSVANSVEKEAAFNNLDLVKRKESGFVYWARDEIPLNNRVHENSQRNLLQPKFEQEWDSHAVEASSYALLVYLIRDGVTIIQERIVEWLNTMRMHDGGFISTVDTLIAMQALTEYSYRARLRDITQMKVTIEATGEDTRNPYNVTVSRNNLSTLQIIPIKNVWGAVYVDARGAGQAIMQLDVSYGVDWDRRKKEPPIEAFNMFIRERFDRIGNKSTAIVSICAQWINYKESNHSSAAVIEVENPTGYMAFQLDAEQAIMNARRTGSFPSIRDVIGGHGEDCPTKTVWFFDFIPGNESWCFEYSIRRWYPVANMTAVRMAYIYEQYQPERFQMVTFNSTTNSLDVCEVCGSYQCPYCPIYSIAVNLHATNLLFIMLPVVLASAIQFLLI